MVVFQWCAEINFFVAKLIMIQKSSTFDHKTIIFIFAKYVYENIYGYGIKFRMFLH